MTPQDLQRPFLQNTLLQKLRQHWQRLPVLSKSFCLVSSSPWTVSCAPEVCCPTLKLMGPQSSSVTFFRIKVWRVPWTLISFISLDCRGTSPRNHWASWVVSWDSLHSKTASSPSYEVTSFSISTMVAAGSLWKGQLSLITAFKRYFLFFPFKHCVILILDSTVLFERTNTHKTHYIYNTMYVLWKHCQ